MEKPQTTPESLEHKVGALSKELTVGNVSRESFLNKILELDQSDPERKSSLRSAEILLNPDTASLFEGTDEQEMFYGIRSLTLFHKAQIRLSQGDVEVRGDLQIALEDSEKSNPPDATWPNYIRATIAYLDNDLDSLRTYVGQVGPNNSLVQNFVSGLEERGAPNYLLDYSKERE